MYWTVRFYNDNKLIHNIYYLCFLYITVDKNIGWLHISSFSYAKLEELIFYLFLINEREENNVLISNN